MQACRIRGTPGVRQLCGGTGQLCGGTGKRGWREVSPVARGGAHGQLVIGGPHRESWGAESPGSRVSRTLDELESCQVGGWSVQGVSC